MRDRLFDLIAAEIPDDIPVDRLPNVDAIVDHLLAAGVIVPPCKVGDVVYCVQDVFNESNLQVETIVKKRIIDFVASASFIAESDGLIFAEIDFGKTVFLTREAAEKALEERREKDATT